MADPSNSVLVAISGGVDSAVAAHRLGERGLRVVGVHMDLGPMAGGAAETDARAVAERLGIELHVVDCAAEVEQVAAYFAAEYARGRTPNPCARCNRLLKFGKLIGVADDLGCGHVATGHYARIMEHAGRAALARAAEVAKDQSYALFAVRAEVLSRVLLPIGELPGKSAVRDRARRIGLHVADKPDSQEICFVPDDDYARLLAERAPQALQPGPIVNQAGEVVGRHEGVGRFTVGQRRGLGVAAGEPMYVTGIDAESATVTIGPRAAAQAAYLLAEDANFQGQFDAAPDAEGWRPATVQIRYNHRGAPGRVRLLDDRRFEVRFDRPVHAITPGQVAALYEDDRLVGGGWIAAAGSCNEQADRGR